MSLPFQLTGGLPDCRLKVRRDKTVPLRDRLGFSERERVFCANCGANGGLISKDWAAHVFYLCDLCVGSCGAPPFREAPESVVRG